MPENTATNSEMIYPREYSKEIMEKAEQMKSMIDVPEVLNSDYFFARQLYANDGNVEVALKRIKDLLEHRQLLGYADISDFDLFTKVNIGKQTFERFNISLVDYSRSSHNVHVFVQKMEGTDLNKIMKVIPLSYVLHSYFMLQEVFSRAMASSERKTGKPSSVVCILDLKGLNLTEFLNPLSGPAQLARLVVHVWATYFSEHLCKLLIINPPGIISLMWQITRRIIDAKTSEKLAFLSNVEDLKMYLTDDVIPVEYGGNYRDDSGYAQPPEGVCKPPLLVAKDEHKSSSWIWKSVGREKEPPAKHLQISSHKTIEMKCVAESAGKLVYSYTASGDVEFDIVKEEGENEEKTIWPKITLTSLKLPESGVIDIKPGHYKLRFHNPSNTWFPVKVNCSIDIIKT